VSVVGPTETLADNVKAARAGLPLRGRSLPAVLTLAVLLVLAGLAIPSFLLPERLLMLGEQVAPLALVATGQTIVLLIGGLDLSVGSVLTLSLVLGAGIAHGSNDLVPVAVISCLLVGAVIGTANGLIIVRLRIPALITTIAMSTAVQGVAWVYTNGAPNGQMPETIKFLANGRWGILPVADVLMVIVFLVFYLLQTRTVFGRQLFAIGANPRAATLSGVRVSRVTVAAYALCGMLAAAGGLLLGGYIAVGSLDAGNTIVLTSLAVVLIGGTSFAGGQGGVVGSFIGVAILAVLTALLIQLGVPVALRSVLLAVIVIGGAVLQGRRVGN
jgi:ribose transport system permease protein